MDLARWMGFAVTLAGIAAVLAGLVFVALSVNLQRILRVPGLAGRAGETLIVFLGTVIQCAFLIMPGLGATAVGISFAVIGLVESAVVGRISLTGVRQETAQPWAWDAVRVIGSQVATLPVVVAGILLVAGRSAGLYVFAGAVLFSVAAGTANAWVLIVEVARDDRYRPAGASGSTSADDEAQPPSASA